MVHQPRRRAARLAGLLACGAVVVGMLLGVAGPPGSAPVRFAAADDAPPTDGWLDPETQLVFNALNRLRARSDLARLDLDRALVESAERDACAIARGELQLSGNPERLVAAGGELENVGLVVEEDPLVGARTIHEWWTRTPEHQVDRLDPDMRRYGIGACVADGRTYYVERFAS